MVRSPRPEDLSRLAEIHTVGWRFAYHGIVPDEVLYVERTVEKAMGFWKTILAAQVDQVLVYDDGILKGFVLHAICRDEDAVDAHEIGALYAEPAFVRQGVGSALVAAAEAKALEMGRAELKLWALEGNYRGRGFYEARGFRLDGGAKVIEEWNGARELRYSKRLR